MNPDPVRAAGAVVHTHGPDGSLRVLLIKDRYGAWTLPKGHLKPNERPEDAAIREIAEETGITCAIERPLAQIHYPVYKNGVWRTKEVTYFLARAAYDPPVPATDEGITAALWVSADEALTRISYDQVRDVTRRAIELLSERI